jgi:hypothetical protein
MVKSLLIIGFLFSFSVKADLFDFGSDKNPPSRMVPLIENLKTLQTKQGPGFEEQFNQIIKNLEVTIETEKLYCSGEMSDSNGRVIPPQQKQFCMRQLKKYYLEVTDLVFELKKKYLARIHLNQIENLTQTQKSIRADIEKNF